MLLTVTVDQFISGSDVGFHQYSRQDRSAIREWMYINE